MDLAGNVWEWTADWYDRDAYQSSPDKDPRGPEKGSRRVMRGGGFSDKPGNLRSAKRWWADPAFRADNLGLRCCSPAR